MLCLTLSCLSSMSVAQEIYRWTDAQGRVHFGQRPQAADAERVDVRPQVMETTALSNTGGALSDAAPVRPSTSVCHRSAASVQASSTSCTRYAPASSGRTSERALSMRRCAARR